MLMRWFTAPFTYHLDVPVQMRLWFSFAVLGGQSAMRSAPASTRLVPLPSGGGRRPGCARKRLGRCPSGGWQLPPAPAAPHSRRPKPAAGPRGEGRGGGRQRPGAPRPAPSSIPRARPAGRPRRQGWGAEGRGVPATAPLLKAKAGAPPRGGLLPGAAVPEGLPSNLGKEIRRAKVALWKSRYCYSCAVSSHLMPVSFRSNASKRCGGFQKVAMSWADWMMSLSLLSKM